MYLMNDVLVMKKPHPCGGKEWKVVGVGADIKIQCLTCNRYVTLTRDELDKRVKGVRSVKDGTANGGVIRE